MPVPYQKHGRRHATNGEDPIPGLGASEYGYPTAYTLLQPHILNNGSIYSGYTYTDNLGTNRYNQFYIDSTTNGHNWGRIVRLGPDGSLWGFTLVMRMSSDAGKVQLQIASLSEDGSAGTVPGTGTLQDGEAGAVTWYDLYSVPSSSINEFDLYQASTSEYEFFGLRAMFHLSGTGALASTPTLNTSDNYNVLDAGAGMYGIKFLIDGKNASSSSYRARFHYAELHRLTEDLYET